MKIFKIIDRYARGYERRKYKNRLEPHQINSLESQNILFASNTTNYLDGRKKFDDKKFTKISGKPKNPIEGGTRKLFYNIIDHYPNTISEIEKVKDMELYVIASRNRKGGPGKHGTLYNKPVEDGFSGTNFTMINVLQDPNDAAHTLFHELRHAQQTKGLVNIKRTPTNSKMSYDDWQNTPSEKDAEEFADNKVIEGRRMARPPFEYE